MFCPLAPTECLVTNYEGKNRSRTEISAQSGSRGDESQNSMCEGGNASKQDYIRSTMAQTQISPKL